MHFRAKSTSITPSSSRRSTASASPTGRSPRTRCLRLVAGMLQSSFWKKATRSLPKDKGSLSSGEEAIPCEGDGGSSSEGRFPLKHTSVDLLRSPISSVASFAGTRVDEAFGVELERCESGDSEGAGGVPGSQGRGGDAAVEVVVGRRRRPAVWAAGIGRKIMRRVAGLRCKGSKAVGSHGPISAVEGKDSLLLTTPSSPPLLGNAQERAPTSTAHLTRYRPSISSLHWSNTPHPSFPDLPTYILALTAHVQERHDRGVFDPDVISFRFAGAAGNQEDGQESLFYASLGDGESVREDPRDSGTCVGSVEAEIRACGPEWAAREVEAWFGEGEG